MHSVSCFVVLFVTVVYCEKHLPKNFPRCYKEDPQIDQCVLTATETVRPLIIPGVPAMGMPPIEPFQIKHLALEQGSSSINVRAVLNDVKVHGLSKYKFTKFHVNMDPPYLETELYVPGLTMDGTYKVDGKILVVPIQGRGKFNASLARMDVRLYQEGKLEERNGKHYVVPVKTNTTIHIKDPKIYMDGLFDGNDELSKLTTQAINDNINSLYEELRPTLEKIFANFLQKSMGVLAGEISVEEIYPSKS